MLRPTILLGVLLLYAVPVWPARSAVEVSAKRDGEAIVVEAQAHLAADSRVAWQVLTDYGSYARFVPGLQSSQVLARSGNTAIIEQKGVAGFFLFRYPLQVRLSVTEFPDERIVSHAIAGNFREMSGTYELRSANGVGGALELIYSGRMVPAFSLPPLLGIRAVRSAVAEQFGALVDEIARRALLAPPAEMSEQPASE